MKKILIGVIFLFIGCQTETVKTHEPVVQPPPKPIIIKEPIERPACAKYERSTNNPAIDEWLKKELTKCRGLTN